jgi:hypothetical protein
MLAWLEMFDPFAHGLHHAGVFRARHKGQGGLIWYLFCTISRSGKFRLAALTSSSTWPGPGCGVGCSVHFRVSTPVGWCKAMRAYLVS